jgi:hypothetical protein
MEQVIEKNSNGAAQSHAVRNVWNSALKAAAVVGVIVASLSGCASVPATQVADANWCYAPSSEANCRPIIEVGNWH